MVLDFSCLPPCHNHVWMGNNKDSGTIERGKNAPSKANGCSSGEKGTDPELITDEDQVGKYADDDPNSLAREHIPRPSILRRVPIISWGRAGEWNEAVDPFQPRFAEEWIDTTATKHPNAFALVVHGDSMEPEFIEGEMITVDPGRDAVNGIYVIAKNGNEVVFKQFVFDAPSVFSPT